MPQLFNLARMTTATTGTGTITLGVAVSGYLTFALAGVANGNVVFYGIKDGASSEAGYGTYTSSGTTLTRNIIKSTNSNTAITLSGSAEVYITAIAADGGDLLPGFANPLRGFDTPINLQLNASVASSLLTVAVKGNNGSDPSNSNPVLVPLRDATAANGDPVWVAITAALSINTNATGASLGSANGVPFRLWVVLFNNGGTPVLALWQSVTGGASPTAVAPLNETAVASSTAMSGSATSAGTFYTPNGTTVASKAFRILGYVEYASGLTTAGTYASAPTTIQLFGPGVKKPGDLVQMAYATTNTGSSITAGSYATGAPDSGAPVASITPSATPNLVEAMAFGSIHMANAATNEPACQLFRGPSGAVNTAIGVPIGMNFGATSSNVEMPIALFALDAPGTTTTQQYTVRTKNVAGSAASGFGPTNFGTPTALVCAKEIMV